MKRHPPSGTLTYRSKISYLDRSKTQKRRDSRETNKLGLSSDQGLPGLTRLSHTFVESSGKALPRRFSHHPPLETPGSRDDISTKQTHEHNTHTHTHSHPHTTHGKAENRQGRNWRYTRNSDGSAPCYPRLRAACSTFADLHLSVFLLPTENGKMYISGMRDTTSTPQRGPARREKKGGAGGGERGGRRAETQEIPSSPHRTNPKETKQPQISTRPWTTDARHRR